jgi:hypothetical protein
MNTVETTYFGSTPVFLIYFPLYIKEVILTPTC